MSVTLPHEREILAIVDAAFQSYGNENSLTLIITDTHEHCRWIIQKLHDGTRWDENEVKLFREGVEVKGGGRVVIRHSGHPEGLMGLRPDRIILMGRLGELFYHLKTMDCEIEAIG